MTTSSLLMPFENKLRQNHLELLRRTLTILQVNIGKLCNQACHHCHVEAGPNRPEIMTQNTVDRILELLAQAPQIHTVDITGGAPELNPHFKYFVVKIKSMGKQVIDRCNLTVLFERGQEDTAGFLRDLGIKIVASLPCYSKNNVDKQRGHGVFDKSIKALLLFNELGYADPATQLELDLVYNPVGPSLPAEQGQLEKSYRQELWELFGIRFNRLYTITNMPIQRFLRQLKRQNRLQEYMDLLVQNFNPLAAQEVMCRDLVSIGWDGQIYDCDFNQMLEIPIAWGKKTIWDIPSLAELTAQKIAMANHCYGCTAGAGSSCAGSLTGNLNMGGVK